MGIDEASLFATRTIRNRLGLIVTFERLKNMYEDLIRYGFDDSVPESKQFGLRRASTNEVSVVSLGVSSTHILQSTRTTLKEVNLTTVSIDGPCLGVNIHMLSVEYLE